MIANPMHLVSMLLLMIMVAAFLVASLFPLIDTMRGLIENGDASRYLRRTPMGEREAEYIYGIRNYLRDFTKLFEADRRALVLWDDFLLYAVTLGQNPQVVNELMLIWRRQEPRQL